MSSTGGGRPWAEVGYRIADRRRELSRRRGRTLRQKDVASALEVAEGTVIHWEAGRQLPSGDSLLGLARVLETSARWLRYGEGEPDAAPPPEEGLEEGAGGEDSGGALISEVRALRLLGDIAPVGEASDLKRDQLELIRRIAQRRGADLPAWWYDLLRRVDAGEL